MKRHERALQNTGNYQLRRQPQRRHQTQQLAQSQPASNGSMLIHGNAHTSFVSSSQLRVQPTSTYPRPDAAVALTSMQMPYPASPYNPQIHFPLTYSATPPTPMDSVFAMTAAAVTMNNFTIHGNHSNSSVHSTVTSNTASPALTQSHQPAASSSFQLNQFQPMTPSPIAADYSAPFPEHCSTTLFANLSQPQNCVNTALSYPQVMSPDATPPSTSPQILDGTTFAPADKSTPNLAILHAFAATTMDQRNMNQMYGSPCEQSGSIMLANLANNTTMPATTQVITIPTTPETHDRLMAELSSIPVINCELTLQ
jgi:hypothetical protein